MLLLDKPDDVVANDSEGNRVFGFSELGYSCQGEYSDGVVKASGRGSTPVYLDKEGNKLFETVDDSDVIDRSL